MPSNRTFSRRRLLTGAAGLALAPLVSQSAQSQERSPYGPFKMGIQSYSLRAFNVDQALQHSKNLGLTYWEAFGAHVPLTTDPAEVRAIRQQLDAAGVRLLAHGVSGFGGDRAANRRVFESAKMLGIETVSADPAPEALDHLDDLVEEFQINIAIHNHGPGHRYDTLADVVKAVEGRHPRLGASVDTGHFLRSREDPVKVIEALGNRVHGVHLKDVRDARVFTILGDGDLDVPGVLRALRAIDYDQILALEYEENPEDPICDIRECLAVVRAAVKTL
jgi:inosose dehydratase